MDWKQPLYEWGISDEAIEYFGLMPAAEGYKQGLHAHKNANGVCYPCLTPVGKTVYRVRQFDKKPKYLAPGGEDGALSLYCPRKGLLGEVVHQAEGTLFIVEGEKDVWVLASAGIYNATSIFGGKNISSPQLANLDGILHELKVNQVLFPFDVDREGFGAAWVMREMLSKTPIRLRLIRLPGEPDSGYDTAVYWKDAGFDADALWQGITITLPDVTDEELAQYAPEPEPERKEYSAPPRSGDNWFEEYHAELLAALHAHGFGEGRKKHNPCIFPENHKHGDQPPHGTPSARISFDKSPMGVYVCHCLPKQGLSLGKAEEASLVGERVGVGTWETFKERKKQENRLKKQHGIGKDKIDLDAVPEDTPAALPETPPSTSPIPAMPEDSPLWDVQAERHALGAIFADPRYFKQVWVKMQPDDFKVAAHVWIYTAMGRVHNQNQQINITSVLAELKHMNQADEAGGIEYLRRLAIDVEREEDWHTYVDVVVGFAIQRAMLAGSQSLTGIANDPTLTIEERQQEWTMRARQVSQRNLRDTRVSFKDLLSGYLDKAESLGDDPDALFGLRLGFSKLDRLLRGTKPGESTLIAGPTSIGKTSFLLSVAINVMVAGGRVGYITMEMSPEMLTERLMQMFTRVSLTALSDKLNFMNEEDGKAYFKRVITNIYNAAGDLSERHFLIESASAFQPVALDAAVDRWMTDGGGVDIVFVDYLQKMKPNNARIQGEAAVADVSDAIKAAAMSFNVPVWAAASLNRTNAGRPQLSSLKGSGDLEYDADVVGFLYNPRIYRGDRPPGDWQVDLIVDKNRNGNTGAVPFTFERTITRYMEADRDLFNEL